MKVKSTIDFILKKYFEITRVLNTYIHTVIDLHFLKNLLPTVQTKQRKSKQMKRNPPSMKQYSKNEKLVQ